MQKRVQEEIEADFRRLEEVEEKEIERFSRLRTIGKEESLVNKKSK